MVTITTNTKISLEHSKVLMDHFGNLQVTNKIGICCGNLMVTITADMKIGLEHSKFLWIMLAIVRSPTKTVMKEHVCTDLAMVMQTLFNQQPNSVKSTVEK